MGSKHDISAAFPYDSLYIAILDSTIHYIDEGDRQAKHTFLLLHGNPTSSYLWRNVIPHLTPLGRVVVPDLIGMGKSGKPDIDYTFKDHIAYMDAFIASLKLKHIIPVVQDWGSGIGFHYANRFPDEISGLVFLEAIMRPISWSDTNLLERFIFKRFRHPKKGYRMIVKKNFFVKRFLPMMAGRKLTKIEMGHYNAPYPDEASRKPLFVWPSQIAIDGHPKFSTEVISAYSKEIPKTEYPKLMFHVSPGMIIKPKEAEQIKQTWNNLSGNFLGKGKHYIQEQYPNEIGLGISGWYTENF